MTETTTQLRTTAEERERWVNTTYWPPTPTLETFRRIMYDANLAAELETENAALKAALIDRDTRIEALRTLFDQAIIGPDAENNWWLRLDNGKIRINSGTQLGVFGWWLNQCKATLAVTEAPLDSNVIAPA